MAKTLFFNVPTTGHVNPSLPLTAELVRRGEQVIYYLTEGYRAKIEATGAEFRPYPALITDSYFDDRKLNGSEPPRAALMLMTTTRDLLPTLIEIAKREKPDYILFDSMCPWGYALAQTLGIPGISSMSLLFIQPSALLTPAGIMGMLSMFINGVGHVRAYTKIANELAHIYHTQPLAFRDFFSPVPELVINYTSAMFQPGGDKMDLRVKFVGPSIESRVGDDDFPYENLDARPLIYISLGTVINDNPNFFKACLEAFTHTTRYQVVMAVGQKVNLDDLGTIPENFTVQRYVPQLKILQRAKLFITHGGMNSVQEGLYYRVPLLIVPQQTEQEFVARRVQQLEAGMQLVRPNKPPDPSHIRYHAEHILNNKSYRHNAARVGESLRAAGGHRRAADEILKLVQARNTLIHG